MSQSNFIEDDSIVLTELAGGIPQGRRLSREAAYRDFLKENKPKFSYPDDCFNPKSKEYFVAGFPVFPPLKKRFYIDWTKIREQRLKETAERFPILAKLRKADDCEKGKGKSKKNHYPKRRNPASVRGVLDITTGLVYESIKDAAEDHCYHYKKMHAKLSGLNINETGLVLLNKRS